MAKKVVKKTSLKTIVAKDAKKIGKVIVKDAKKIVKAVKKAVEIVVQDTKKIVKTTKSKIVESKKGSKNGCCGSCGCK